MTLEDVAAAGSGGAAALDQPIVSAGKMYAERARDARTEPWPLTAAELSGYLRLYVFRFGNSSANLPSLAVKLRTYAKAHGHWAVGFEEYAHLTRHTIPQLQAERPAGTRPAVPLREPTLRTLCAALRPRAKARELIATQMLALTQLCYAIGARAINVADGMGQLRDLEFHAAEGTKPAHYTFTVLLDKSDLRSIDGKAAHVFATGRAWDAHDAMVRYVAHLRQLGRVPPARSSGPERRPVPLRRQGVGYGGRPALHDQGPQRAPEGGARRRRTPFRPRLHPQLPTWAPDGPQVPRRHQPGGQRETPLGGEQPRGAALRRPRRARLLRPRLGTAVQATTMMGCAAAGPARTCRPAQRTPAERSPPVAPITPTVYGTRGASDITIVTTWI